MTVFRNTLIYITILFALLTSSTGCTRNNGDIGEWFGIWRVDSIETDGQAASDYAPPYMYWKFQSGVIQMLFVNDESEHTADFCYGSWEDDGEYLTLNFDWDLAVPPPFTHLGIISRLKIVDRTDNRLSLQYIDESGMTISYKLQKWG